ncbi:MAG: hypothetical protein GY757_18475 [bacterium]|nr:hypothetical protein [bacterium]
MKNGEKDRGEDKGLIRGFESRVGRKKECGAAALLAGERVRGSFEQTTNSAAVTPRFI